MSQRPLTPLNETSTAGVLRIIDRVPIPTWNPTTTRLVLR